MAPKLRNWLSLSHTLLALLGLLLAVGHFPSTADAQSDTTLYFSPQSSTVPLGSSRMVSLLVDEGQDVNSFDITIEYDDTILELDSWSYGDYLSNLSVSALVNTLGSFRLAATQLNTAAVSGDGTLLNLTFKSLAPGTSALVLAEAEFRDLQGNVSTPNRASGSINVILAATYTLTPTITLTPTRTNTPFYTATSRFEMPTETEVPGVPEPTATEIGGVIPQQSQTPEVTLTPSPQPGEPTPIFKTGAVTGRFMGPAALAQPTAQDNSNWWQWLLMGGLGLALLGGGAYWFVRYLRKRKAEQEWL